MICLMTVNFHDITYNDDARLNYVEHDLLASLLYNDDFIIAKMRCC